MKSLAEIKGRCVITEDGHWLWKGSVRHDGRPNIYAPDFTRRDGGLATQCGLRAVWHCANLRAIPDGWRVYGKCDEAACCNPAHILCTSQVEYGAWVRKQGKYKGQTRRILANRAINRARAKVTPEMIELLQTSPKLDNVLAAELGISTTTVSKYRRGEFTSLRPAGGMFSGLVQGGARG